MRLVPLCVVAVLVLLAGCGSDAVDDPGGSAVPTPSPSGTPLASLPGPLVYSRGGGIAGRADRLTIQPDGAAVLESRGATGPKRFSLKQAELSGVVSAVAAADLPSLDARYAPKATVMDGFQHLVKLDGTSVATEDGADPPRPLAALVGRLSSLVDAYGR